MNCEWMPCPVCGGSVVYEEDGGIVFFWRTDQAGRPRDDGGMVVVVGVPVMVCETPGCLWGEVQEAAVGFVEHLAEKQDADAVRLF